MPEIDANIGIHSHLKLYENRVLDLHHAVHPQTAGGGGKHVESYSRNLDVAGRFRHRTKREGR